MQNNRKIIKYWQLPYVASAKNMKTLITLEIYIDPNKYLKLKNCMWNNKSYIYEERIRLTGSMRIIKIIVQ